MDRVLGVRGIVVDIEGTTSATAAVHVGLYNFARPRLQPWLHEHINDPAAVDIIAAIRTQGGLAADASVDEIAGVLLSWMDGDVKATPLKTIQGEIWAAGFADGQLTAQFFDDVPTQLRDWHGLGLGLAVFSSGSVTIQEPWFRCNPSGDLAALMSAYFDTANAGPKREASSYDRIADRLSELWRATPEQLLFLSDIPAELDAAAAAGWQTIGVRRPGEPSAELDFGGHNVVASFTDVRVALAYPTEAVR